MREALGRAESCSFKAASAKSAEEAQVEAAFREAIATAQQQKLISLEKRAEATYAEYRRQQASAPSGCVIRIPLC